MHELNETFHVVEALSFCNDANCSNIQSVKVTVHQDQATIFTVLFVVSIVLVNDIVHALLFVIVEFKFCHQLIVNVQAVPFLSITQLQIRSLTVNVHVT